MGKMRIYEDPVPEPMQKLRAHLSNCEKWIKNEHCDDCKTLSDACPPPETWRKPGDPLWAHSKLDTGFIYAPHVPERPDVK